MRWEESQSDSQSINQNAVCLGGIAISVMANVVVGASSAFECI